MIVFSIREALRHLQLWWWAMEASPSRHHTNYRQLQVARAFSSGAFIAIGFTRAKRRASWKDDVRSTRRTAINVERADWRSAFSRRWTKTVSALNNVAKPTTVSKLVFTNNKTNSGKHCTTVFAFPELCNSHLVLFSPTSTSTIEREHQPAASQMEKRNLVTNFVFLGCAKLKMLASGVSESFASCSATEAICENDEDFNYKFLSKRWKLNVGWCSTVVLSPFWSWGEWKRQARKLFHLVCDEMNERWANMKRIWIYLRWALVHV